MIQQAMLPLFLCGRAQRVFKLGPFCMCCCADYRMIQQAMLDMEQMFQLLGTHPALQVGSVLLRCVSNGGWPCP